MLLFNFTDQFSITSPNGGTPVICGGNAVNIIERLTILKYHNNNIQFRIMRISISCILSLKGQHMIVDSDGTSCSHVNFGIGSVVLTRTWDIMVRELMLNKFVL